MSKAQEKNTDKKEDIKKTKKSTAVAENETKKTKKKAPTNEVKEKDVVEKKAEKETKAKKVKAEDTEKNTKKADKKENKAKEEKKEKEKNEVKVDENKKEKATVKKENSKEQKDEKENLAKEKISDTEKVEDKESSTEQENYEKDKVNKILSKAKEKGRMTYGELASELEDVNPEDMDKVFDAFEEIGVDLLSDDFDDVEPDIDELENIEEVDISDAAMSDFDGINIDDPVRMYLREIGRIPLLTYEEELELAQKIINRRRSCKTKTCRI